MLDTQLAAINGGDGIWSDGAIWVVLFWGFLIAALVWLIAWLLLRDDESAGVFSAGKSADEQSIGASGGSESGEGESAGNSIEADVGAGFETQVESTAPANRDDSASSQDAPLTPAALSDPAPESEDVHGELEGRNTLAGTVEADESEATGVEDSRDSEFSAELASGQVRYDDELGIVYLSAPDETDDLTQIKGVGKVLEDSLHNFGVYRFRQIACWAPEVVTKFNDRLSFKGRIERDDWIKQARDFHRKKYGEEL